MNGLLLYVRMEIIRMFFVAVLDMSILLVLKMISFQNVLSR